MPQQENQPLSKIQSIDTTILQEYMQLFLSTHSEHFNLIKSTLTDQILVEHRIELLNYLKPRFLFTTLVLT